MLCEIESKERSDINDEVPESLVLRLLTSLQIFKFQPETENPYTYQLLKPFRVIYGNFAIMEQYFRDEFREGLVNGRPETIHPILNWLLQRREELKKRAYLARFLVKIDIAPEMRSDSDVVELFEQVI